MGMFSTDSSTAGRDEDKVDANDVDEKDFGMAGISGRKEILRSSEAALQVEHCAFPRLCGQIWLPLQSLQYARCLLCRHI
jgi:hypothetical protein